MPYDYPGEYAMRFDGVDVGHFRELVATPSGSALRLAARSLELLGPGTIELHDLRGVSLHGDVLLHRWQRSSAPGGPPHVVTIEARAAAGAVVRWRLRNARPMKWVMKPPSITKQSGNAIAIETLTIAHDGLLPVD